MSQNFLRTLFSDPVLREQERYYGRSLKVPAPGDVDQVGPDEAEFIQAQDSFYMATVSPDGWPYLQHRGGPRGFLRVRDSQTLIFADLGGNRQLLSTGNLVANDRITLFLMDYPQQARLKILGHAEILPARSHPELLAEFKATGVSDQKVERFVMIHVTGLSWNCPQHITPRFTAEEIEAAVAPLHQRIRDLESALARPGSA